MLSHAALIFVAVLALGGFGVAADLTEVTDEEYSRFPRLFHLDDYDSCLAQPGGLYCVGTFYTRPLQEPDPVYELMKDFSKDRDNFNHTLLHRGYCVSSRCGGGQRDNAARFADCAAQSGRKRGYRLTLQEVIGKKYADHLMVRYCRTHAQKVADQAWTMDTPRRIFLAVVCTLVIMNVVGTVYDITKSDSKTPGVVAESSLLTAWSLRSNWSQLVGPYPDGDPRLAAILPVEGGRVIMMLLVIFTHVGIIHDMLYLQNPRLVELMSHHPIMMLLQNGSSSIQIFILLSSFLLAQKLLNMTQPPSFTILPKLLMKRIIRIAPVYLLVVSFAATWWPASRDGPMWRFTVAAESDVCRRKFWTHALFINNFVDSNDQCLVQTWFIAVETQLYVVACAVSLCLLRARRLALPILGVAVVGSCVFNYVMSYLNRWKPLMFVSGPENIRTMYRNEPSFREYYCRPHGSLPSMLIGLFLAHLYYELNQRGFKPSEHKLLIIGCQMLVPLLPCWTSSGYLLRDFTSREFMSLYIAIERPGYSLMSAALLFGTYNGTSKNKINKSLSKSSTKGFLQYVFWWRGWYPLGRVSLAALMVHWCVAMALIASRLNPVTTSALHMTADFLATTCCTYLISVPVTLMLEIPMKRFYSAVTS